MSLKRSRDNTSFSLLPQDRTLSSDSTEFTVKMGYSSAFTLKQLIVCSLVMSLLVQRTSTAPVDEVSARCPNGSYRRNVCEKCSKETGDDNAYDLCCTQESAQGWCEDFVNFTLNP